ncbi:response regulator [Siccirubricoccus sp. KC 17139]|uniref:histidine kinase n=1 Tax=Siccirubricoccus soli TaxID=2899147 RepID=A0ABT1DAF4_9PROT|nr:ATP-binding protein [Siccirubricoccus soli]MCO6418169.1 response regulator [Siccirubricoccus soli]MCP2684304.1 response regulator [Siccirubricoccus soli]
MHREAAEIEAERVAVMFRQTPFATLVTMVNALLMAGVMWQAVPRARLLPWLAAMLLLAAGRFLLWLGWQRRAATGPPPRRWGRLGALGIGLGGLLWGGGAAWLWPESETYRLFWVFAIGGMCVGAGAIHAAHAHSALAFILLAGLPLAARFALDGTVLGLAAAAMILVLLVALCVISWRAAAAFGVHARMRLDLAAQARSLDAANARLRAEIATRQAAEASLHHAQKMEAMGQLTGGIAHDFNNLLMAVQGSLDLLRKRLPPGDARTQRLLENARLGTQRGAALTQRLLAFGRRQKLQPSRLHLPAMVQGVRELLDNSLRAGIRLEISFPPDLPPVLADANQLELALLNLVVNARDAMPEGGVVTIGATLPRRAEEQGLIALTVTDTGTGMDAATLAQAMKPFFTTKGAGRGTGLGLAMVQGLAAQSGGRFLLRSAPGQGTVAELWLPGAAAAEPAAPSAAPAPAATPGPALAVLLVDDDPLVLASLAEMLADLGHRTVTAASGPEALARLDATARFDLVITDHAMPGMTGLQLAEALARLRPGLPVLLATGYAELDGACPAGLTCLAKPFSQETLAQAIRDCLAAPAPGGPGPPEPPGPSRPGQAAGPGLRA